MIGYRRAAVALHGLHEEDRNWILEKLANNEKTAVNLCLDEIKALGFSPDQSFANEATALFAQGNESVSPLEKIRRANAADIHSILRDEPLALVAKVFSIADWPWRMNVLASFNDSERSRLQKLLSVNASTAPVLAEFMMIEMASRLLNHGKAKHDVAGTVNGVGERKNWLRHVFSRRKSWSR